MGLKPGEKVGRYEIASFLGAGGMGQVYRARDSQLARDVAIKLLPTATAGKREVVERFHKEAKALGLLNHPNLVTVFDFGTHGDSFYIVLELLEGETLRERLRTAGKLSQRRAIQWALEIVRGMAAAHDRGIIHRDLKPENIFITRDGRLKILDFGLAKMSPELEGLGASDDAPTAVGGSSPGMVLGTVGYIAPEQLRGEKVDHRADIFAFGAILFEMLAAERAFRGNTAPEVLSSVLKEDPIDLRELGVSVLPALDLLLHRCLEKQPQNRFQSAQDLAFAIEALGASTDSMTLPFFTTLRKSAERYRRAAGVGALVIGAAVIGALSWRVADEPAPPSFRQLTFRRGDLSAARFTPDGGIAYSASWEGSGYQLYSGRRESVDARPLGSCRELLAVSKTGALALMVRADELSGTLALGSLSGGAPRDVVDRVVGADFSPDGTKLAVARRMSGRYQIEYPVGRVLYQAATRIRDLRMSPDGTKIAFRRREARLGKSFGLFVIDAGGGPARKIGEWPSARGLVWLPKGNAILFATGIGGATEVRTVTLSGKSRLVERFDGLVRLHDIGGDGHLLLTRDDYREGIMVRGPDADRERDLSWFDGSGASDISPDGRLLLMTEFGEAGGAHYSAYVRPTTGEPAVRLGDGYGVSLSPDGKSALVIIPGTPARLGVIPLGAGASRFLESGEVIDYEFASWLPDGENIVFTGRTAEGTLRLYRQNLKRGTPVPIGDTGQRLAQASRPASPDGSTLAVIDNDGALLLLAADGKSSARKIDVAPGFLPIVWSADGRELFVYRENEMPARMYRLNVKSAELQFLRELMPADAAGVFRIMDVVSTPSGNAYAYGAMRNLSSLFDSGGWNDYLR